MRKDFTRPWLAWTDIQLDSGFKDFYKWAKATDIPVIIVSRQVHDFAQRVMLSPAII